jgi:predicted TIM-barrel fold metal-dependent hydrolase
VSGDDEADQNAAQAIQRCEAPRRVIGLHQRTPSFFEKTAQEFERFVRNLHDFLVSALGAGLHGRVDRQAKPGQGGEKSVRHVSTRLYN